MKRLSYINLLISIIIISFIFVIQPNTFNSISAQTIDNEIIKNTLEIVEDANSNKKDTAILRNSSELILILKENNTNSLVSNNLIQNFKIEDIINTLDIFTKDRVD